MKTTSGASSFGAGGGAAPDAAILAGGRGTRLGGVIKPLLEVGGVPILDRQLAALKPVVDRIAIVAPDPATIAREGAVGITDPGRGPLAAMVCALEWCESDRLLVVAGDLPFASAAAVALLASRAGDIVAPVVDDIPQVLFALYRPAAVLELARAFAVAGKGPRRMFSAAVDRGLVATTIDEATCRETLGGVEFSFGINNAEQLAQARARE